MNAVGWIVASDCTGQPWDGEPWPMGFEDVVDILDFDHDGQIGIDELLGAVELCSSTSSSRSAIVNEGGTDTSTR